AVLPLPQTHMTNTFSFPSLYPHPTPSLQVHFTNPKGRADLIDNSGLYLKLAPSLRPMDASIMLSGPVPYDYLIKIPPGMPSWTQVSTCPGECTAKVFGNESVKIIGSFLHLHTLGRQLYTDVFRKGSKVATISRQDYYDFASQQTIPFTPEFELLPGDELRTSCVWDSSDRTNVTVGGPSTEEEMCIDYLIYYPARQGQEMDACYDFCASYDNETLGLNPNSPTLSKFYVCGPNFIPTYQPCKITFGSNTPKKVVNGCPAENHASLADIPSDTIAAALSAPTPPAPAAALPPPTAPAAASPPSNNSGKAAAQVASVHSGSSSAVMAMALLCAVLALVL
ncbi:unnamed protein product, partial [Closterium sp. NIES-54]